MKKLSLVLASVACVCACAQQVKSAKDRRSTIVALTNLMGTVEIDTRVPLRAPVADGDEEPGLGPQFADLLLHEGEGPLHEPAP